MLYFHYDPIHGDCFPDAQIADRVTSYIEIWEIRKTLGMDTHFDLGSEMLVNEIRLRILRGEIPHDDVQFVFIDPETSHRKVILCSDTGWLSEWPAGFCNQTFNTLRELGKARRKELDAA